MYVTYSIQHLSLKISVMSQVYRNIIHIYTRFTCKFNNTTAEGSISIQMTDIELRTWIECNIAASTFTGDSGLPRSYCLMQMI